MGRMICFWLVVTLLGGTVHAQTNGLHVGINAQRREHDDPSKKSTKVDMTKKGEECTYDITVTNNSLKDAPALTVKYAIFVQMERLGEKANVQHSKRVNGSEDIPALKTQEKATVTTKSFDLMRQNLQAGWSYKNGGRANAKDTVKGIWVKVFDGKTVVGEYANPSGITAKESWDTPTGANGSAARSR
jgi:hypothetical protein